MFALIWLNSALEALADLYVAASPEERERMAAGVDALNARLRDDPLDEGESRFAGFRLVFVPLLAIGFHVNSADRTVRVRSVRRYGH